MAPSRPRLDAPGDYIAGAFRVPSPLAGRLEIRSPADHSDVVGTHPFAREHVDAAVDAARTAFRAWSRLPRGDRASLLFRYRARILANAEALAEMIAREVGKPLWEAKLEVGALATKIDLTLSEASRYVRDERLPDVPGAVVHRALGVMGVIGPFNFPAHLPQGQLVPALALGNTVVWKPSERAPGTATWLARCADEAGLPPGVLNIVQGDGASAAMLAGHADLDGILFTGSTRVGIEILRANVHRPGRMIALELGGKNATVVLDDADVERAARAIAFSAFVTSGQRCSATSRVLVARRHADALTDALARAARSARVGPPFEARVFLGPVIDEAARARLLDATALAVAAGYEPVAAAAAHEVPGHVGTYVRPSVHRAPDGAGDVPGYSDRELFAPDVAVHVVDDLDEAAARANAGGFGLVASVFTASRERFDALASELHVGVVHWNRPTAGASSRLPFGGIGASGNHRPGGIRMSTSCAFPQAVYLAPGSDAPLPSWPGLYDVPETDAPDGA